MNVVSMISTGEFTTVVLRVSRESVSRVSREFMTGVLRVPGKFIWSGMIFIAGRGLRRSLWMGY